jgi:hypothetical protein
MLYDRQEGHAVYVGPNIFVEQNHGLDVEGNFSMHPITKIMSIYLKLSYIFHTVLLLDEYSVYELFVYVDRYVHTYIMLHTL